jgi:hypothetical protein
MGTAYVVFEKRSDVLASLNRLCTQLTCAAALPCDACSCSGGSMGTAYVVFEKRSDALAAFNRYNNVALDNKKMSIEVVESAVPRGTFKTLSSGIK